MAVSPAILNMSSRDNCGQLMLGPIVLHSGCIETPTAVIESAFQEYTERPDIAILLINQHVR
jgi:hypothetical protein